MNTVQAFAWNVGTYGLVTREDTKRMNRKVQSTDTAIGAEWLVVVNPIGLLSGDKPKGPCNRLGNVP